MIDSLFRFEIIRIHFKFSQNRKVEVPDQTLVKLLENMEHFFHLFLKGLTLNRTFDSIEINQNLQITEFLV